MRELPLSPTGSGIWVNETIGGLGAAHNVGLAVTFDGALDLAALAAAVDAVVERHPVLATAVAERDGRPCLVPARDRPVLQVRPAATTEPDLAAQAGRGFELRTGPLSRFVLDGWAPDRHRLLVVAHHLVFDGTSKDVLLRELAAHYRAARTGAANPDEPAPRPAPTDPPTADHGEPPTADHGEPPTADHGEPPTADSGEPPARPAPTVPDPAAGADRRAAALPAARDYWAGRWREQPELVLPGWAGPVSPVDEATAVPVAVPADLHAALGAAAERIGVSRFEVLLASVQALLLRYGNPAGSVATDLGTRAPGEADLIGSYANEVPLPVAPDPAEPFDGYARRLRTELRELYRFRAVPLGRAVPGLRPMVSLAPVTVSYRRRIAAPEFPGVTAHVDWVVVPGTVRGALRVYLVDGPGELDVLLECGRRALPLEAARQLAGHWLTLLRGALAAPETPIRELPLLSGNEQQRLRVLGAGPVLARTPSTVPDLVAEQRARTPQAVAVVHAGGRLTYGELDAAAERVAAELRARGVGPGALVGVCAGRGGGLLPGLLGVLKAGAAYLPLDPAHPPARLAEILADSGAALLLTGQRPAGTFPPDVPHLDLDRFGPERTGTESTGTGSVGTGSVGTRSVVVDDGDARAYVIYTSGSTGRPKGVAVGHRALANVLLDMRDRTGAGPDTVWLALTSPSFDIAALELFLPLICGGRVVLAPDGDARDPRALHRLIAEHGVTHLQATPTGWRMLLAEPFEGAAGTPVTGLVGGEPLPLPVARELRARVGRLWNVYGPTETTIWSTAWEVPPSPVAVRIGRPIANTTVEVRDAAGQPVPVGVPGELHIGGAGVAQGYPGRPELTARLFQDGWYRTGDLVRWTAESDLEHLGRLDEQVKLRGYRIEPGEIEARLVEHPAVAEAAVVPRTDAAGETHLLACVVAAPGARPDPAVLRAHLARVLPDYMVPGFVQEVPALPLTTSGKLDRRALPGLPPGTGPEAATPPAAGAPAAPNGDSIAARVGEICREVLQRNDIGPDDDLFDLGAHSLTLTRISSRIRTRLGADIPLLVLYDDPTVAAIAAAVAGGTAR